MSHGRGTNEAKIPNAYIKKDSCRKVNLRVPIARVICIQLPGNWSRWLSISTACTGKPVVHTLDSRSKLCCSIFTLIYFILFFMFFIL